MSYETATATGRNDNKSTQPAHEAIPTNEVHAYCDGFCPARARVRVDLISGNKIFFCGHHYNENAIELITVTHVIRDEREWKPEDPSFVCTIS